LVLRILYIDETLQPFYLNSFVKTKSYSADVDQLSNPYLGINTTLATVDYITHTTTLFIEEYSNIEYGRISSDPFELSGASWYAVGSDPIESVVANLCR
jgi:hypothetical protein